MPIPNPWVVTPLPRPLAETKLFCFPYAGGGVPAFRNWPEALGPGVEVLGVQLPGRGARVRERPANSIAEIAEAVAGCLAGLLDRPFAFYGHSLGALIAFETLRAVHRIAGREPQELFVGACHAPQFPWPYPPMHGLPQRDLIRELERRYRGVPREIVEDAELCALLMPILRADLKLVESYVHSPEAPLECPITAFGGVGDQIITASALEGWRRQTTAAFCLEWIDGDHFFLETAPGELLRTIGSRLRNGGAACAPQRAGITEDGVSRSSRPAWLEREA